MTITSIQNSNSIGDIYLFLLILCLVIDFVQKKMCHKINQKSLIYKIGILDNDSDSDPYFLGVKIAVESLIIVLNSSFGFIGASIRLNLT